MERESLVEMLSELVEGPAVRRADRWSRSDEWIHHLTVVELDELRQVCDAVAGRDPHQVDAGTVPIPATASRIRSIVHELDRGRGVAALRGLPLGRDFDHYDAAVVFWAVCSLLGRLVPTERSGALLNHVYDRGPLRRPDDRGLRYWISRSGLSPRRVSPEYEFIREDNFGLTRPVPELARS